MLCQKRDMNKVREIDPEISDLLDAETQRQEMCIDLIAAENFTLGAVLEAQGSLTTNKGVEGYPGKRYHGGIKYYDIIENLAIERAKRLFGAEYANVQPHSGTTANLAIFFAVLNKGDKILSMELSHGGHLSHGYHKSVSGQYLEAIFYHVSPKDEKIDFDEIRNLAKKHRPKMIVAGGSAYPRTIDFSIFREIANEIDSYFLVDMSHIAGLVAAEFHPNPVPYADFVSSTLCKTLRGGQGAMILCKKSFADAIDKAIFPGMQSSTIFPLIVAKAICLRYAMTDKFKKYIEQVCLNNKVLANSLEKLGYRLVSGGTDNHIVLVDLQSKRITGKESQDLLEEVGIIVNKNPIPFDKKGPVTTSGIRVGSAAMTARGFGKEEFKSVAGLIDRALDSELSSKAKETIKKDISLLCQKHPIELN